MLHEIYGSGRVVGLAPAKLQHKQANKQPQIQQTETQKQSQTFWHRYIIYLRLYLIAIDR